MSSPNCEDAWASYVCNYVQTLAHMRLLEKLPEPKNSRMSRFISATTMPPSIESIAEKLGWCGACKCLRDLCSKHEVGHSFSLGCWFVVFVLIGLAQCALLFVCVCFVCYLQVYCAFLFFVLFVVWTVVVQRPQRTHPHWTGHLCIDY